MGYVNKYFEQSSLQYLKRQANFSSATWITIAYLKKLLYLECILEKRLIFIVLIIV